jgi:hypothetical protein
MTVLIGNERLNSNDLKNAMLKKESRLPTKNN